MKRFLKRSATAIAFLAVLGGTAVVSASTASAQPLSARTVASSSASVTPDWNNKQVCNAIGNGTLCMQATGTFGWDGVNMWYSKGGGSPITADFHWADSLGRTGWDYGSFRESSGQTKSFWWSYDWPSGVCVNGYLQVQGQGDFFAGQICNN